MENLLIKPEKIDYYKKESIINIISDFIASFKSYGTKKRYRIVLENFFLMNKIFELGNISKFTVFEMRNLVIEYEKEKTNINLDTKKILNPSTVNNINYIIKSFFNYLVSFYGYPKNPLEGYKKVPTKENSTTDSLNRLELFEILNYLKRGFIDTKGKKQFTKKRDYLIVSFLSLSLRRSEVCNLEWKNIDESKQYISVNQKGGTVRIIPIPNGLFDYLKIYKSLLIKHEKIKKYIFTPFMNNTNGNIEKPISTDYLVKIIKRVCKELNIEKNITPHSFRKTFIELSLNKNENHNDIMNATGHKSSQMIRYYDNRDKIKQNSINKIDWF